MVLFLVFATICQSHPNWIAIFPSTISHSGFGLQPTWLAGLPLPLMISIDHCLHSQSILTFYRSLGLDIGSDHLPLLVKVQL